MKCFRLAAALVLCGASIALAQSSSEESRENAASAGENAPPKKQKGKNTKSNDRSENSRRDSDQGSRKKDAADDNEVRVRYNDQGGRLSINVEDDMELDDPEGAQWAKDGDFDARYDVDENSLQLRGEGTIDVERAASNLARWWQSWWREERSARRSLQKGSESGARLFVQYYDRNDDGHLSKRELTEDDREDFDRVDRNGDDYLSISEVRRYGQDYFEVNERHRGQRSKGQHQTARQNLDDDSERTWDEWWASWWSEQDQDSEGASDAVRKKVVSAGVRRFMEQYDRNGDGLLVRSELPASMHDDFSDLDDNDDRRLTREELRQHISHRSSRDRE